MFWFYNNSMLVNFGSWLHWITPRKLAKHTCGHICVIYWETWHGDQHVGLVKTHSEFEWHLLIHWGDWTVYWGSRRKYLSTLSFFSSIVATAASVACKYWALIHSLCFCQAPVWMSNASWPFLGRCEDARQEAKKHFQPSLVAWTNELSWGYLWEN